MRVYFLYCLRMGWNEWSNYGLLNFLIGDKMEYDTLVVAA